MWCERGLPFSGLCALAFGDVGRCHSSQSTIREPVPRTPAAVRSKTPPTRRRTILGFRLARLMMLKPVTVKLRYEVPPPGREG